MRRAKVFMHGKLAGVLSEVEKGGPYRFIYQKDYDGVPVSLTMPVAEGSFQYALFPPFFEGLLPEGIMLEGLLRQLKIDRHDYFSQLVMTGTDLVGAVTVKPFSDE